jgi:hypothetical protein
MAVVKKDGNPIPLLNPEGKEEMAELIGAEVYLLIGERAIFKD